MFKKCSSIEIFHYYSGWFFIIDFVLDQEETLWLHTDTFIKGDIKKSHEIRKFSWKETVL